ncbi:MAG: YifB family Mg chelatase-like AAA ATPase [Clostridiales bacterium]|nr:YifB family Mg chelatase-like AAA ATPase [Clostridiales bacterium]
MFSKVFSAAIHGIDGMIVSVEADVSDGLPVFDMVGFLGSEVKEARERVKIALRNSGFRIPAKRITVNLSPADIRKEGTAFDLPVAIAILGAFGYLPEESLKDILIIGELSLNGKVNKVNGVLPIVYCAKEQGFKKCIIPMENGREGAVVEGIETYGVSTLAEVVEFLNDEEKLKPLCISRENIFQNISHNESMDFSDVTGQKAARRAIEIAVAGMHNILMIGPPGSGKTMMAKRIPTIMPELSFKESMEISKIYSIAGLMDKQGLILRRPFRSPHHTITTTALVGGGRIPRPGEVSLADQGVLFLDELPEFQKNTIEVLRQPLEDRAVSISRLNGTYRYPANFMLAAAMNPCNCGYYPDRNRCNCSTNQVKRYLGKISQPLLDRFYICIEALEINYKELAIKQKVESSEEIRNKVRIARDIQINRYKDQNIYFNSQLNPRTMKTYCKLDKKDQDLLEQAFIKMNLSARAYHRILKVARTIADLDQSQQIKSKHISEAICYRSLDQKYFGAM